jgi:3-hydroxyacyl-CoA dehydrogenase
MTQTSSRSIKKVAVLGSGVMGSRIACHFANIGVNVLLLDIVPRELTEAESKKGLSLESKSVRNRIVNDALQSSVKGRPAPLYSGSFAKLIETGNFDDDFDKISDCDWILEAVIERLDIKKIIFDKVEKFRKPGSIISSNTSGIPIYMMSEGRSEDFQKNFVGTHFFNPPRYLRLLEVIPGPKTDPELVNFMMRYGDLFLGKQTVLCKDTPAFIANRVGIYAIAKIFKLADSMGLTIEEVDRLTGPAIGRPKTGTFRLGDLVGLDTAVKVIQGIKDNCPDDEQSSVFEAPPFLEKMLENKWFGDKTGQGFYKKSKDAEGNRQILSLDLNTLEYREKASVSIPSLGMAKNIDSLPDRLRSMFHAKDKGGEFVRKSLLGLFAYVSNRIPEISDDLYKIDDAMCAGFGWDKGPFEVWDMVGAEKTVAMVEEEGLSVAEWVKTFLSDGNKSFYRVKDGNRQYYDIPSKSYKTIPGTESLVILEDLKSAGKVLWENGDSALIDLGDGVLNVEFRSKMNAIGDGVISGILHAIDFAEKNRYNGIVLGNEATNFSVGANLALISMMAYEQEWDELNLAVKTFQDTSMRIRYSRIPVVAAPHGMALGGGCEFTMHSDKVVASAETYTGLVEVGVGLIPAGGGTKEFTLRAADRYSKPGVVETPVLQEYLMNIATAKVATSAVEAQEMDIFRSSDQIVVNQARRLSEAKEAVLELATNGYTAPSPRNDIKVLGRNALSTFYAGIYGLYNGQYASEHDMKIAKKVAYIMCGGDLHGVNYVSEQYLLDLERDAFLSLLGEIKTLQRIENMLKTGKPLRN